MARKSPKKPAKKTAAAKARREASKRRVLKKHAEEQIDAFLRSMGAKDPADWTDEQGLRRFTVGEADGMASVDTVEGELEFNTVGVVMPLPSDKELVVPLMRELLESNYLLWGQPRFSIANDTVVVSATQAVDLMRDEDYGDYIHGVMTLADMAARDLRKKFGGTVRKRRK